jgi:hypothetical protein
MSLLTPRNLTSVFHDPDSFLGRTKREELRQRERQENRLINTVGVRNINQYALNNPDSVIANVLDGMAMFTDAIGMGDDSEVFSSPLLEGEYRYALDLPIPYREKLTPDQLAEKFPETGDFFKALDKKLTMPAAAFIWDRRSRLSEYAKVHEEYERIGSSMLGAERFEAGMKELGLNLIDPLNFVTGGIATAGVRVGVNLAAKKVGSGLVGRFANHYIGRSSLRLTEDMGDFVLAQSAIELSNVYQSQEVGSGRDWLMGAATALTFGVGMRTISGSYRKATGRDPVAYFNEKEFNKLQGIAMDPSLTKSEKEVLIEKLRQGTQTAEEFARLVVLRDEAEVRIKEGNWTNLDNELVYEMSSQNHAPTVDADNYAAGIKRYTDGDGSDLPADMPPAEKQQVRKVRDQRSSAFRAAAITDHPALQRLKFMKKLFNREVVIVDSKLMDAEYSRGRVYRDEPGVIYLNSRLFEEDIQGRSSTFALGHELFHTIARSDPELARQLEDLIKKSTKRTNIPEEELADVFGEAFESDVFWNAFGQKKYGKLRQAFIKFWDFLTQNKKDFPELKELHIKLGKRLGSEKKRLGSLRKDNIGQPFTLDKSKAPKITKEQIEQDFQGPQVKKALRELEEGMKGEKEYDDSSFAPTETETPYVKKRKAAQEELAELKSRTDADILEDYSELEVDLVKVYEIQEKPETILDMTKGKRIPLVDPSALEKIQNSYIGGALSLLKELAPGGVFLSDVDFRNKLKELRDEALKNNWSTEQLSAMMDIYEPGKPITLVDALSRFQSMYRRDLAALQSETRALKQVKSKGSLERLYQWMVGGWSGKQYEGIGNSVSTIKKVRSGERGSLLTEALNAEGKYDEFFQKGENPFAEEVAKELSGVPTGNASAKNIADVIKTLYELDGNIKKSHGAITDLRSNRILGTTHNRELMLKAGKDDWVRNTMKLVDSKQMNRFVDVSTQSKMNSYLENTYDKLIEQDFTEDIIGINYDKELAKQLSARKMIIFKDIGEYHYDRLYGSGNPSVQILNQIHKAGEYEVILESFGPSIEKIRKEIIGDEVNFLKMIKSPIKFKKRWLTKIVFDQIIGDLDHPVNKPGASQIVNITKNVTKVTDLATLELAGFSSPFYDLPTMVNQMMWMGMPVDRATKEIGAKVIEAQKRYKVPEKAAQALHVMGAAADMRQFAASRIQGIEAIAGNTLLDNAHRKLFEYNQLMRNTQVHQEAIHDVMQQWVGELAHAASINGKLPQQALLALKRFDIDIKELQEAAKYTTKENGLTGFRLAPFDIKDKVLRNKLSNFFDESMRTGVLEPDDASVAIGKLGLKAGTVAGAAVRILGKFRAYELANYRQSLKRNIKGFGHDKVTDFIVNPTSAQSVALTTNMMVYASQAIMLAGFRQVILDTLNLKDPRDTLMSGQRLQRILESSGTMPLIQTIVGAPMEFAQGNKLRAVLGELGPFVGLADKSSIELINGIRGADFSKYRFVSGLADFIPGKGVPGIDQGIDNLFAGVLGDTYSIGLAQSNFFEEIFTEVGDLL